MELCKNNAFRRVGCLWLLWLGLLAGCGTTQSQQATEQLLLSGAVDRTVASIDFRELSGHKVYLDTKYLAAVKGMGFVNASYIIGSLRQQLVAANCLLQDTLEEADYVVEARVGALGADVHDVTYGVPANNMLSAAASLMPNAPAVPTLPEIALGKRQSQSGVAKIAVFAYHRETRQPVWQSGIAQARSTAKNTWLLGAGPFQGGTIYGRTQFAGSDLRLGRKESESPQRRAVTVAYDRQHSFARPLIVSESSEVQLAGHEEAAQGAAPDDETATAKEDKPAEPAGAPAQ